ncbi:hypothetical protein D9758_009925 [Tetrapyrgos nigripes]|uniref:Xylanolytic transcriptional activator regulatory domain-containing protein n=1 Tax=Tetrapyrgos nigripes TaxID=182062 RepID=A0A8H5FR74_9AGAR|nr:hypothetical protein D9758_009925 [Tetrapyrgos nigripes]
MRLERMEKILQHIAPNHDFLPKEKAGLSRPMSAENRLKRIENALTRMSPNSELDAESEFCSNTLTPGQNLSSSQSQTPPPVNSTFPPSSSTDSLDLESAEPSSMNFDSSSARMLTELVAGDPLSWSAVSVDDGFEGIMDDLKRLEIHPADRRFYGKSSNAQLIKDAVELRQEYTGQDTDISGVVRGRRRPQFWKDVTTPIQNTESAKPPLKWSFISKWENNITQTYHPNYVYPPPDLLYSLVDLYFTHFNLYLPLLHRPTFDRAVAQGLHLCAEQDENGAMFGGLLLLVCALGSRYSNDERVLIFESPSKTGGGKDRRSAGWKYFKQVHGMRKSMSAAPNLYDLQWCALAAQFLQGASAPQSGWALIGIGIRVLLSLDRMLSVGLGRPCAIQDDQYDVDLPLEVDDEYWENPDPEKTFHQPSGKPSKVTAFNLTLRLNRITGIMLRTIYAISKSRFGFVNWPLWEQHIVAELDSALNKWVDTVPGYLRWDPQRKDATFFNQSVMMYIQYYILRILLHQSYIRYQYLSKTSPSSTSTAFPSFTICSTAARSCVRVVEAHRKRNGDIGLLPAALLPQFMVGIILLLNVWRNSSSASSSGIAVPNGDKSKDADLADVYKCLDVLRAYDERMASSGRVHALLQHLMMLDSPSKAAGSTNDSQPPVSPFPSGDSNSSDSSLFESMSTTPQSFIEPFVDIFGLDFVNDLNFGQSSFWHQPLAEQLSGTLSPNNMPNYNLADAGSATVSGQSLSLFPGMGSNEPSSAPGGSALSSFPQNIIGDPAQNRNNLVQNFGDYSDYENFFGSTNAGSKIAWIFSIARLWVPLRLNFSAIFRVNQMKPLGDRVSGSVWGGLETSWLNISLPVSSPVLARISSHSSLRPLYVSGSHMSSDQQQSGPLADADIYALTEWIAETATGFVLYGIYVTFSLFAIYLLIARNSIRNRPRIILLGVTAFMLLSSTAYLILTLEFIVIQIPLNSFHPPDLPRTERLISNARIAANFMERINFLVNDGIVVWRAWILFPRNRRVKATLAFCMFGTTVCSIFDAVNGAIIVLNNGFGVVDGKKTFLVLTVPLLVTNIIATLLIGYKAWRHRLDIQRNLGSSTTSSSSGTRGAASATKVQKILFLMVESGLIYIAFWFATLFLTAFGDASLLSFQVFIGQCMPYLSALYPVLIIILVSLETTREESQLQGMSLSQSMRFAEAPTQNVEAATLGEAGSRQIVLPGSSSGNLVMDGSRGRKGFDADAEKAEVR